jgi:small-conductance mechanosensitive channel
LNWFPAEWPEWIGRLIVSLVTVAAGWVVGHLLNAIVVARLRRVADHTRSVWDDIVLQELPRRLPVWLALVGAWLAVSYWPINVQGRLLAERLVFVAGAASVTLFVAALVSRVIAESGATRTTLLPVTSLTRSLAWGLVVVLGLLVILNGLGISITPMLTALGVGGLAVALALQEPLSNLFAGLFVTLAGQMRVGDYLKLDSGEEGYVVDFSWRSTRLRMLSNNVIIVPNARLSQAVVTNYHLPSRDLAVLVDLGVDYASDLAHVERVTIDVARSVMQEVTGAVPEFEPFVRFHTFGQSSIDFSVIMRGSEFVDQFLIKHEFAKRLHARYEQEGIVIPFPIRTLITKTPEPTGAPTSRA